MTSLHHNIMHVMTCYSQMLHDSQNPHIIFHFGKNHSLGSHSCPADSNNLKIIATKSIKDNFIASKDVYRCNFMSSKTNLQNSKAWDLRFIDLLHLEEFRQYGWYNVKSYCLRTSKDPLWREQTSVPVSRHDWLFTYLFVFDTFDVDFKEENLH